VIAQRGLVHILPASALNDTNVLATYCARVLQANGGMARAVPHVI